MDTTAPARIVRRPATTFKVRRRGLSPKRQAEFDQWVQRWGLHIEGPMLDSAELFGHQMPVVLDVGFGHGETTVAMARAQPDVAVIGVEVHTPGVVTVLDAIENDPLANLRVVHGDLLPFLDRIGPASLAGIRVFFPDPWIKARQRHRRLIRDDLITGLTDRLQPGGFLHLATDIDDYATQMNNVCQAESRLDGGPIPRPEWRPVTRFEQRGLDAGRQVVDLYYVRQGFSDGHRATD